MTATLSAPRVGVLLRDWRHRRRSQLDLAVTAGVSARHLSFVETGHSRLSGWLLSNGWVDVAGSGVALSARHTAGDVRSGGGMDLAGRRGELEKYNPGPGVVDKIVSVLAP